MAYPESGVEMIAEERRRVLEHLYPIEHDQQHWKGELLQAAYAYMLATLATDEEDLSIARTAWPFESDGFKPEIDPIDNLAKAGQFIAADIDRLQYKDIL